MTIMRIIDGKEHRIELTPLEMNSAYFEQQRNFDMEDVESYAEEYLDYRADITAEELRELFPKIADKYRFILDDMDWWPACDEAYRESIKEWREQK